MNFMLKAPSLEHMTSVEIAIKLWSQVNVSELIAKSFDLIKDNWQETEDIVVERASKLHLPVLLKKRLLNNIQPVGLHILSWVQFHCYRGGLAELPAVLLWTPHGTIDSKRIAEIMVKDDTQNKKERFIWACCYCLEDYIVDFRSEYCTLRSCSHLFHNFETFWINYLKENDYFRRMQKIFDGFIMTATWGNESAIRYFCLKLSSQNTEQLRMEAAKIIARELNKKTEKETEATTLYFRDRQSNVLFFLMSTMNVKQQEEIFKSHTYGVLRSLLVWPRQSLFLEMVKDKWNFLSEEQYCNLLNHIVDRMSSKRSYLKELFLEFWRQTPETYKQYFIDGGSMGSLLLKLFKKEGEEIAELILKDSSIAKGENLIFSYGQDICLYLVLNEKWDSVEHLIQECISSQEEMIAFKNLFQSYVEKLRLGVKLAKEANEINFIK